MRGWRFAIFAGYILAALPMVPAMAVNVDWGGAAPIGWKAAAVAGIVLAALLLTRAR